MDQDRAGLGTQAEKDIVRSGWCSLLLVRRLDGYVPEVWGFGCGYQIDSRNGWRYAVSWRSFFVMFVIYKGYTMKCS
jgi:hypothetical protein